MCVCLPTVQMTEEAKASPVTVHFLLSLKLFSRAVIAPVVCPYLVQTSAIRNPTLAANGRALAWHQLRTVNPGSYSMFQPALGDGQICPWALSWSVKMLMITSSFSVLQANNFFQNYFLESWGKNCLTFKKFWKCKHLGEMILDFFYGYCGGQHLAEMWLLWRTVNSLWWEFYFNFQSWGESMNWIQ